MRAPEVPDFEIAVTDRDQVRPSAEAGLREELAHWGVSAILSCDLVGRVWLEELEVPFPPASDMEESTDDSFELEGAGDDLTLLAAEDRLGRFDRRDDLLERIVAVLASPGRSSVILVGPPDVGKSALVHELASRVASGRIPPALQGRPLWRLSANELIAGARFTGMWQDRARLLVARGRAERVIFVMGDPTAIVDAGRWSESENNLARFLRTHVESGDLTLICEATPETFGAAQAKEPSFIDAFYRVDVPQPAVDVAREIVAVAAKRLEAAQSASVSSDAVDAAVELTVRFEPYRGLPGKAVRLLEEASQHASTAGGALVTRETVVTSFAARSGLPLFLLSDEIPMSVEQTLSFFEDRVLGQAEAVTAMVDLLAVAKAGLNDPSKPLGTFFFVGPTGVGKTELSKALAEFLFGSRDRVIRFDMGEFASADAVQRLVGTAWSRDREGELTRRVREQPFCVVLLDEIEKAHSSVYPALLAALGEGRMTDANGRTADFRSSIIIMTSNLGAARRGSQSVGFTSEGGAGQEADRLKRHFVEQAERFFQPEFFNRIDHLIAFHELSEATVRKIARRELGRLLLREGIARRRLLVEVDDRVVDRLAVNGFHPEYGARPLQRFRPPLGSNRQFSGCRSSTSPGPCEIVLAPGGSPSSRRLNRLGPSEGLHVPRGRVRPDELIDRRRSDAGEVQRVHAVDQHRHVRRARPGRNSDGDGVAELGRVRADAEPRRDDPEPRQPQQEGVATPRLQAAGRDTRSGRGEPRVAAATRSLPAQASAFVLSWSNSACVIAPLSSSSLPFAIWSAEPPEAATDLT